MNYSHDFDEYVRFNDFLWEETPKAYRLSETRTSRKEWIPKSTVESITKFAPEDSPEHGIHRFVQAKIKAWVIEKKFSTSTT